MDCWLKNNVISIYLLQYLIQEVCNQIVLKSCTICRGTNLWQLASVILRVKSAFIINL